MVVHLQLKRVVSKYIFASSWTDILAFGQKLPNNSVSNQRTNLKLIPVSPKYAIYRNI